jgi:Family of unknown function (DUF6318)
VPPRALVSPALALVAALALLSGCSDDGRPQAAAAATAKTKASPSATATETAKPYTPPTKAPGVVPIKPPDKTTAGIFVLVWFETLDYGYATGDADPLRQSVTLGCFTCANWIIEVQTQANKHLERTGGYIHVRQLVFVESDKGDYVFRAVLDRDPGVLAAPDGKLTPISPSSGEPVELRVGLTKSALTNKTTWTMKSVATPTG